MEHPPRIDCAKTLTSFKAIRLFIALACSHHRLTYSSVLGAFFYFYWGENFLFSRHFILAYDVALCACVSDVNKLQKWHQTSNRSKNSWFDRRGNSRCLRNFLFDDTSGEKVFPHETTSTHRFITKHDKTRCGVTNLAILRKQNINSFGMMRETNVLVDLNWIKLCQLEMKLSRSRRGGAKYERNVCRSKTWIGGNLVGNEARLLIRSTCRPSSKAFWVVSNSSFSTRQLRHRLLISFVC